MARQRARRNPSGIGAAYVWRPVRDPGRVGWCGTVVISDGAQALQSQVTAKSQSPYTSPNADRLAAGVERLIASHPGSLPEAVAELGGHGDGIDIDALPNVFH